jgi:hypothetical protein
MGDTGAQRSVSMNLFGLEITDRRAVQNRSELRDAACGIQQCFDQRGFSRPGMRNHGDVSNGFHGRASHDETSSGCRLTRVASSGEQWVGGG